MSKTTHLPLQHLSNKFITIDPGCRTNGGTGCAWWTTTSRWPIKTALYQGSPNESDWDTNIEQVIYTLEMQLENDNYCCPVYIERPKFFESLKGLTAASSDGLFKLICAYARIFQICKHFDYFPQPLHIKDWKRGLNKDRMERRIRLVCGEKFNEKWKGDILDAVGMGLYIKGILYG
jgi:hypothetical protein